MPPPAGCPRPSATAVYQEGKKLDNGDLPRWGRGGQNKGPHSTLHLVLRQQGNFPKRRRRGWFLNRNFPLENEATPLESGGRAKRGREVGGHAISIHSFPFRLGQPCNSGVLPTQPHRRLKERGGIFGSIAAAKSTSLLANIREIDRRGHRSEISREERAVSSSCVSSSSPSVSTKGEPFWRQRKNVEHFLRAHRRRR